jgi:hypothetical protein
MRSTHVAAAMVLTVILAAVGLVAGVRLLAPHRDDPAVDFAELAVAAARRVEAYGARHGGFRHLRTDSVLAGLPPGVGLRVSADSAAATIVVLSDGQARCSIRVTRGQPLTQPRCTDLR